MLNLNEITPKKFGLDVNAYDKIFMMWKDQLTFQDIADEFNLAKHQVSIVVNQIISFITATKQKHEQIMAYQKLVDEALCSYKDLLFPIDNEPTIGTSKVVNGKIYSDGKLWK
jgi:hypothetical protein